MTPANQDLYDRLIDAFSMRSFVPTPGFSGHDQFFATFARFGGLDKRHMGEWVDEVASRAAAQNQQYLELMETPPFGHAARLRTRSAGRRTIRISRRSGSSCSTTDCAMKLLSIATMCARPKRGRREAGTLRNTAGHAGVPGRDSLYLPGAARLSAGAGVCADAAGL